MSVIRSLLCVEGRIDCLPSLGDPVLMKLRVLKQLLHVEELLAVNPKYLETTQEGELSESLRREVVFWMASVCEKSACALQVLPVAVNLLDRVLSVKRTKSQDLLVVAAACLLTASKLLQADSLTTGTLRSSASHLFTTKELLAMELCVLRKLHWEVWAVTPYDFLDLILPLLRFTKEQNRAVRRLVSKLVCASCSDYNCVIYPPSLIAVGAICVAADCLKITWRRKDITMLDYLQSLSNCEQSFIEHCKQYLKNFLPDKLRA